MTARVPASLAEGRAAPVAPARATPSGGHAGLLRRAHRRHAGRGLPHHLHPRAGGLDVDDHLPLWLVGLLGRGGLVHEHPHVVDAGQALAPTGAMFTFVALWTGALWGKPTWGTWWVWDARLTSELLLLFLYLGFIALVARDRRPARADRRALWRWWGRSTCRSSISRCVVEHAAPGRIGQPDQGAQMARPCCRHAADGGGVLGLHHCRGAHGAPGP
jgi:hypothetical protein